MKAIFMRKKLEQIIIKHRFLLFSLLIALIIRVTINIMLARAGYFYGIPWDSFTRTAISFQWAAKPFFAPGDGYWLALQFWLAGSLFSLLKPISSTTNIMVLVALNHAFFIGSLILIHKISSMIGGKWSGFFSCILASIFAGDVFVTYSGLSEPLSIFFILLASYWFVNYLAIPNYAQRSAYAYHLGIAAFLAAANHYLGWYLAAFLGFVLLVDFILHIQKASKSEWIRSFVAIALCGLLPILWLLNSQVKFGDFMAPLSIAKSAQAAYIGQMPLFQRLFVIPKVLYHEFRVVSITGLVALVFWLVKDRKALLYLVPSTMIMIALWGTTAFGLSAPYQEPRYLVFAGWILIPYISSLGIFLWNRKHVLFRLLSVAVFLIFIFNNISDLTHFRNSFDRSVKDTAKIAEDWILAHPGLDDKVFIENLGFAEQIVIPITSGNPSKFIAFKSNQELGLQDDPIAWFNQKAPGNWIVIVQDENIVRRLSAAGLKSSNIGPYHIFELNS